MYKIFAKYAPFILVPNNAIDTSCLQVETQDGIVAGTKFVSTWNNCDGRYSDELNDVCKEKFGVPFTFIRSVWYSRLGEVSDIWHLIKLETDG